MSAGPPPKLLLDEDISPHVANRLVQDGIDATHVRNRARLGATDREVLEIAYNEDRILVTANVADFEKLARSYDLHRGIILIEDGSLLRDEQYEIVGRALRFLEKSGHDLINHVLHISQSDTPRIEALPAS